MAIMGGNTVYDRMKQNGGFLTGPKHQYGPAMDDQPQGDADDAKGDGAPPNLRDAGDSPDSCADCIHFDQGGQTGQGGQGGGGACKLYGDYPVTPNQICDSFEGQDDGDEQGEEGGGGDMMGMRSQAAEQAY